SQRYFNSLIFEMIHDLIYPGGKITQLVGSCQRQVPRPVPVPRLVSVPVPRVLVDAPGPVLIDGIWRLSRF
ncbi:unnamed protein product, partial [Didymodactylos carnosus]